MTMELTLIVGNNMFFGQKHIYAQEHKQPRTQGLSRKDPRCEVGT